MYIYTYQTCFKYSTDYLLGGDSYDPTQTR